MTATPNIETLQTPLLEKHRKFQIALAGLRYFDALPPLEKDARYFRALKIFLSEQLAWEPQLFADHFAAVFDLDDNQTNILLGQHEFGEIIGAMAFQTFSQQASDYLG